jgi:hypothetical protein
MMTGFGSRGLVHHALFADYRLLMMMNQSYQCSFDRNRSNSSGDVNFSDDDGGNDSDGDCHGNNNVCDSDVGHDYDNDGKNNDDDSV